MCRELQEILGESPSSTLLTSFLESLCLPPLPSPEVKIFPDAVYFNYFQLGLSLLFTPTSGYKPSSSSPLAYENLRLDSIDVYNAPTVDPKTTTGKKHANIQYTPYPQLPILIPSLSDVSPIPPPLAVTATTTGKDMVSFLGEPSRKGGGSGPSSGSIGIWCEWKARGLMVEFGGDEARGAQAWERGKDAHWTVITFFKPPT